MNELIEILVQRDGITRNEAIEAIQNCLLDIIEASGSYDKATDAVEYWLGLEPDYLDILLNNI